MAIKSFNRTVEQINPLLDKLDALPLYPMNYKGEVVDYSDLPEEPTQGDCYLISFEAGTEHVANRLYYYSGTTWKEIAVDGYTKYEINQMIGSLSGGVHWLGAVNYYSSLPSNASLGDAYTVLYEGSSGTEPCGDEYVWGTLNSTDQWILFGKETYTKAQIDTKLAEKQDTIDSSHKISADNVDDTSATHKFATSAQLTQIETNKNNILTINAELIDLVDSGAKNLYNPSNTSTGTSNFSGTITRNSDGSYTINGTTSGVVYYSMGSWIAPEDGYYILSGGSAAESASQLIYDDGNWQTYEAGNKKKLAYWSKGSTRVLYIRLVSGITLSNVTFYPMICSKAAWDVSQKYVPYAMSNAELTAAIQALQAQLANQ